jgi:uncharacterized membrane protein
VALSGRSLAGALLVGWGVFNLVEGLIDHHVLHVHHVTETANHLTWDLAFLGASVFVLVLGAAMIRTERGERSVSRLSRTPDRKEAYS